MARIVALFMLAGLPQATWGQVAGPGQPGEEKPAWTKLTLTPRAAPVPALKYQLLPELRDLKPGNAALLYQRAHSPEWFSPLRRSPDYEKYHEWLEVPLEKFPREQAAAFVRGQTAMLNEVDLAARRIYCEWELEDRLRKDGISLLIPDVQSFREYAALLRLRARVHLVESQYDKAVHTLQTGYALGRHVSHGPTLIQGLVGIAIVSIMNKQVEELVQQPGAPNLYWALADLPRPLIDLRRPMQGERLMVEAIFPGLSDLLADVKSRPLTTHEIQGHLDRIAFTSELAGIQGMGNIRAMAAVFAAQVYPEAKKFLIAQGRQAADVERLPVIQVSLLYTVHEYERRFDDIRKWLNMPYWEAVRGLEKAEAEVRKRREDGVVDANTLGDLLLPAIQRVALARHRADRQLAALQIVEALRLHAAGPEGRLPARLDDIRDVPIPRDPITGKAFDYRVEGGKAFLTSPAFAAIPPADSANIRYEIRLHQEKK